MILSQLRSNLHTKLLSQRAVDRIVASDLFAEVYLALDFASQTVVVTLAMQNMAKELRAFIRAKANTSLDTMSFDLLRNRARNENIPVYSRMNKQELLLNLKELVDARTK